jgi:hypothetical protein
MTTISNLSLLVQQGGNVRETQNIRQQMLEANQSAELQNQEKIRKQIATVEQSENSQSVKLDQNRTGKRKRQYQYKRNHPEKNSSALTDDNQEEKGSILDTIA